MRDFDLDVLIDFITNSGALIGGGIFVWINSAEHPKLMRFLIAFGSMFIGWDLGAEAAEWSGYGLKTCQLLVTAFIYGVMDIAFSIIKNKELMLQLFKSKFGDRE